MDKFFITLLNMSLVAVPLIIVLIVIRPFMKKAPKAFLCALWGLVGLRLVCPFSFESILSLLPTAQPISIEKVTTQPVETFGGEVTTVYGSQIVSGNMSVNDSLTPLQILTSAASLLWITGFSVMLVMGLISYLRLLRQVSASVNIKDNVFINDDIKSPFVLGFLKPRVYIPSSLTEYEKEYVIAHENAHIKRRDYILKPIGYILLSLHWFNPLVWVAYIFLCRDIESACDERVVSKLDAEGKRNYSDILLRLSIPNKSLRACPVAFGEIGIKSRVKSVLSYKKPGLWVGIVACVLTVALSVGFLTNPVSADEINVTSEEECITEAIVNANKTDECSTRFYTSNYIEVRTIRNPDSLTRYIMAYYGEYTSDGDDVNLVYESYEPACAVLIESDKGCELAEYVAASDINAERVVGEDFSDEIFYSAGKHYSSQRSKAMLSAKVFFGVSDTTDEKCYVLNAQVLSIGEDSINVRPLDGETVSGKTFGEVIISKTNIITSQSFEVGDVIKIRYTDSAADGDVVWLLNVLRIETTMSSADSVNRTETSFVVYSQGNSEKYFIEPMENRPYIYDSGNMQIYTEGVYFTLNQANKTFVLIYCDGDSHSLCSGNYDISDGVLILDGQNSDVGKIAFEKVGKRYIYSESKTNKLNRTTSHIFSDGDSFVFCK